MPPRLGDLLWSLTSRIRCCWISSAPQQFLNHHEVASACRRVQWRRLARVAHVDGAAHIEEPLHVLQMACGGGPMQRRVPNPTCRLLQQRRVRLVAAAQLARRARLGGVHPLLLERQPAVDWRARQAA
eukprot:CAMPEP_0205874104 /NCGR_PEP_ID=MMETSP1083-20121108/12535_1 /ASSEMBLY_ACC=CAM_ASM_000430 /TAXON_ID=97485 /ORGANISM="Prymnesium parvum, Strain Texoma1" /LENGTH=127 /DNA_ID=CAMNT_0053236673 /DNA_START=311 /DNA_END=691 /DNA_ORIENTATION=+